jgi:hypothetical protein
MILLNRNECERMLAMLLPKQKQGAEAHLHSRTGREVFSKKRAILLSYLS